jgi:hypothetical protein
MPFTVSLQITAEQKTTFCSAVINNSNKFDNKRMKKNNPADNTQKWYDLGYTHGFTFANEEADYEDLAAISREKAIPDHWDIFRAEILNRFLGESSFDFSAYSKGFGCSCTKFFKTLTQQGCLS